LNATDLDKLKMVLAEIDHISVSARPSMGRQTDGVVLLTGHFEHQLLTRLIQISGGPPPRMLDANTMLLGETGSLDAAIQRITRSWNARRTDPLIQRARRLTAEHDFWITGPPPPELAAALAPGGGIRSFTVGMSLGKQIRVVLAFDTTTQQAADRILASYRKLEAAGLRSPQLSPQWNQMSRSLRIERLSPGIQFSVADASPPPDVLLAQLAAIPMFQPPAQSNNSIHAALAALDTSGAAASKSAPANRTIVILGAEGSKELPVR
jgi:replicative DNA helicase